MANIERDLIARVADMIYEGFPIPARLDSRNDVDPLAERVIEAVRAADNRGAVDVEAATVRVEALMIRAYGAAQSDETREQAERLARAALGGRYRCGVHEEIEKAKLREEQARLRLADHIEERER